MPKTSAGNCRHIHFPNRLAVGLIMAVGLPGVALGQAAPGKIFPADPNLSSDRFGLFIGIDHYPVLKTFDLDGCKNDAIKYKEIFVDAGRFNVQRYAVITDQQATRAGIARALLDLVEEVKTARAKLGPVKPITVVITYAGHGAQVPRLDKNSPLGPLDSSWVASDSDLKGKQNIRGEELFAIHTALRNLGAQVIMISDSCHSGTAYRGTDKARGIELSREATGPKDDLFADVVKGTQLPRDLASFNNPAGFVWYAACSDAQKAFETIDEQGKHCGKLSLVMRKVLLNAIDTSYSGLARQIAQEFATRWPEFDGQQTPEFHAAAGKENGVFFTDKVAPLHAEVKKINAAGDMAEISLGEIQGISDGAFFRFYGNMNDAMARNNELATGTVEHADATTSTVKLTKAVPLSAWAMPERVRLMDFSVALDEDNSAAVPPAWLKGKLAELDKSQQIRVVALKDSPSVVVHCLPGNQIGIYAPTALPGATRAGDTLPSMPLRLLSTPVEANTYAEMFAENLLYLARLRRFASLEHANRSSLSAEAVANHLPALGAEIISEGAGTPMQADPGNGAIPSIQRIREGDMFTVRITNNTTRPMYATLFTVNVDGTIKIQYPAASDDLAPVTSGHPLEIGRFSAKMDNAKLASERTLMKVIATDSPVDFNSLLQPPQTGARNVRELRSRGGDDALFNLMRDTLHGGPLTRGTPERIAPSADWGTANVVFDTVPKKN